MRPILDQTLLELCQEMAGADDLADSVLRLRTARLIIPKLRDILGKVEDQIPPLIGKFVGVVTEPKLIDGRWEDVPVASPVNKEKKSKSNKSEPLISAVLEDCLSEKKRGVTTVEDLRFFRARRN